MPFYPTGLQPQRGEILQPRAERSEALGVEWGGKPSSERSQSGDFNGDFAPSGLGLFRGMYPGRRCAMAWAIGLCTFGAQEGGSLPRVGSSVLSPRGRLKVAPSVAKRRAGKQGRVHWSPFMGRLSLRFQSPARGSETGATSTPPSCRRAGLLSVARWAPEQAT